MVERGLQHVGGAADVGRHGFQWMELARGHLLERGRVKDEPHALHRLLDRAGIADITDAKREAGAAMLVAERLLLGLVAREDAYLVQPRIEKAPEYRLPERPGAPGD